MVLESEELEDPYALSEEAWSELGDIYNYLIDSKGRYTKESLKAYKSVEAYNYYISGHVRTVFLSPLSKVSMLF